MHQTKPNKPILSPFCNKGWLLLRTLSAIQFHNHQVRALKGKRLGYNLVNISTIPVIEHKESVNKQPKTPESNTANNAKKNYSKKKPKLKFGF